MDEGELLRLFNALAWKKQYLLPAGGREKLPLSDIGTLPDFLQITNFFST
jgi:hypothetical protein